MERNMHRMPDYQPVVGAWKWRNERWGRAGTMVAGGGMRVLRVEGGRLCRVGEEEEAVALVCMLVMERSMRCGASW